MTIELNDLGKELDKAKADVGFALECLKEAEEEYKQAQQRVKMISALISIQQGGNGNG